MVRYKRRGSFTKEAVVRAFEVAIFTVSLVWGANVEAWEPRTETDDALTVKEKEVIEKQKKILDEIVKLYAERALERPKDISICVREMFAMRRSNKCRDRFTHYDTPEEVRRSNEEMNGKFGGVGIELVQEEGVIVVLAPIAGTPAERAGILPGDIILKVNGKSPEDINEAVLLIRGKVGTKVAITLFRKETKKEFVFTLTRAIIKVQAIKWRLSSADKKIGIIAIRSFDRTVPVEFAKTVVNLVKKGVKGVVIDLRNNPGGLVNSVLALVALFADDTDTLLTYRFRHSKEMVTRGHMTLRAIKAYVAYVSASAELKNGLKRQSLKKLPVVILINNGSASASEIFSGTMKDWGYPIVGEKSYGKGVGQELISLSDGSRLTLTTFEFLVGNRQVVIRDKGVMPTIEVKPAEQKDGKAKKDDKNDIQLVKALEVLQSCGKQDPSRTYKCTR